MEEKKILIKLCALISSNIFIKYKLSVNQSEISNKIFSIYLKDNDPYSNKVELVAGNFEDCKTFLLKWKQMIS